MKTCIADGKTVTLAAAPYAVASGAGALQGAIFGVTQSNAENGAEVVLVTCGIFSLAKATGQSWTVGEKLYWDDTAKNLTTTASGNTLVGAAHVAAQTADTTGEAWITGQVV